MKRAAVVLLLVACGSPAPVGEVRLHLEAEPAHLNPLLGGDALGIRIALGDVVEPLWRVAEDGTLEPVLATSFTRSADDREWTFAIRQGVHWHDGRPLVVEDVMATLRRLLPGAPPTTLSADFDDLLAVEAVDARTVRLRFGGFRLGREESLARVPILPAHAADEATLRAPIGTGPFAFDGWEPGREIRLRRFPDYWGRAPRVERVVYRIVPDRAQALAQLRAGQLDLLATATSAELADPGAARTMPYSLRSFSAVTWNTRRAPLGDARVRRALGHLVDRETIAREVMEGRARLQSGPWPPGDPAADPDVPPLAFDPAGARALLEAAGTPAPRVSIVYPATSRQTERVLTIWQADAARAGVTIALEPLPFAEVLRRAESGEFDGIAMSWIATREHDFFDTFHSSQTAARNHGAFADDEVDRLLEEIRGTIDAKGRAALEHRLHRRLAELQPMTILFGDVRAALVSPRLQGVVMGGFGAPARRMELAP